MKITEDEAYSFAVGSHPQFELIVADGRAIMHRNILKRKSDGKLFEFLYVFLPEYSKFHGDKDAYSFDNMNLYEVTPVEKIVVEYERVYEHKRND